MHFQATGIWKDELLASNPNLFVYQVADTHEAAGKTTGYWENRNEFYPISTDFMGFDINVSGHVFSDSN